jgi:hypothetical protein
MKEWMVKRKEVHDTFCLPGSRLSHLPYYKYELEKAKNGKRKCQRQIRLIDEILKKELEKDNMALWDTDDNMEDHEFVKDEELDYLSL